MNVLSLFDGIACARVALERANIKVDKYYASEIDKYAIKIALKNYPDIIELGDIKQIKTKDLKNIDLIIGGSPCFTAGTKIFTINNYKNIENITVGELVLTHKGRLRKVLKTGKRYAETFTINIQGILPIKVTGNHPFYVRSMNKLWNSEKRLYERNWSVPIWKPAQDLKYGDYVGIPVINIENNKYNLTEEDCWLIGRYIADGHIIYRKRKGRKNSYHYGVVYSIGKNKIEKFRENVKNTHFSCYIHSKSTYRCIIHSKKFVNLLRELKIGRKALDKKIPTLLLLLPKPLLKKLIEGYLSGDGNYNEQTGVYKASTISKELALSLQIAITKVFKVNSSIYFYRKPKKCVIEYRVVNQNNIYEIHFRLGKRKQRHTITIDNVVWLPIKSIIKNHIQQEVYNLEVEEDNTYIANNIIVHNCQDLSLAKKNREGLHGEKSRLFWEYVRILKEINPKYFILENVYSMPKYDRNIITRTLGVEPIMIDAKLVSAQQRKRLFWTGKKQIYIPQPKDKHIILLNIIHEYKKEDFDLKKYILTEKAIKYIESRQKSSYKCKINSEKANTIRTNYGSSCSGETYIKYPIRMDKIGKGGQGDRIYSIKGKSVCLSANGGGRGAKTGLYEIRPVALRNRGYGKKSEYNKSNKANCLTTVQTDSMVNIKEYIRKLTPIECERLQGLPDNYTEGISNTQRYRCLGNAFNVDVVAHILKYLIKVNFSYSLFNK